MEVRAGALEELVTNRSFWAGKRVFVTCYSGYGLDDKSPGQQEDLRRHLLCLDRATGTTLWAKEFQPVLPEHEYQGEGSYHGYAASTPLVDGDRLYVFFGKSGVYCFDLEGKEIWHVLVGKNVSGWGSRWHWSIDLACCFSMSLPAGSMPGRAANCTSQSAKCESRSAPCC